MMAQEANKSENKDNEGYKFTIVKELPVTPVKNQAKAGTCWDYAGTAFLEAELLRMGKGEYDFSEMYTAHVDYQDRAMAAIRTHGVRRRAPLHGEVRLGARGADAPRRDVPRLAF